MPWFNELHGRVLAGALQGCFKGAAAGAAASIATGSAVLATAPAWLPFLGGTALVSAGAISLWSVAGGAVGATINAARVYWSCRKEQQAFEQAFPPVETERPEHPRKPQPSPKPRKPRSTQPKKEK